MASSKGTTCITVWPHELETMHSLKELLREKLQRSNLTLGQAITEAERIIREAQEIPEVDQIIRGTQARELERAS